MHLKNLSALLKGAQTKQWQKVKWKVLLWALLTAWL